MAESQQLELDLARQRLHALYRATRYHVHAPEGTFTLHVDERSEALAALQASYGVNCSCFLTAWNPGSLATADEVNRQAQAALLRLLQQRGYRWLTGAGADPEGRWPTEASLLVLGLDVAEAGALGRQFRQNALVVAGADAVPRLLWIQTAP